jgi:hypothetical protein
VEQIATVAARTPVLAALAAGLSAGAPMYGGPTSDLARLATIVNRSFSAEPMVAGHA